MKLLSKKRAISITLTVIALCALWCNGQSAYASHFRFGHLTWKPRPDIDVNAVEFGGSQAWRRTFFSGTGPGGNAGVGDIISTSTLTFGESGSAPIYILVTSIDTTEDWFFGNIVDSSGDPITHTYTNSGPFTAFWDSCCRIGTATHVNNPDGDFKVSTLIDLTGGNSSPVSSMPPIFTIGKNRLNSFTVPAIDNEGDTLRYRLATSSEAGDGFTQPGPPDATNALSIDSSTGIVTWDTNGATLESGDTLYSCQIIIEELDGGGSVKGHAALDFFLKLIVIVGDPPEFGSPTPCGSTITGSIDSEMTFAVQASDTDQGDTVTLSAVGLPPSATMTPSLPVTGSPDTPVSSVFRWTPTAGEVGVFAMTFTATDSSNQQVTCSITVQVLPENCTNGIDDDLDGDVDCADSDCFPTCSIKLTGTSPLFGINVDFSNLCAITKPIEVKMWVDLPGIANIVLVSAGAVLPAAPFDRFNVVIIPPNTFNFKTGVEWWIRLIDPTTGVEFCSDSVTIPAEGP